MGASSSAPTPRPPPAAPPPPGYDPSTGTYAAPVVHAGVRGVSRGDGGAAARRCSHSAAPTALLPPQPAAHPPPYYGYGHPLPHGPGLGFPPASFVPPPPPLPPAPTAAVAQTATIRNAVNLKKATLKLLPLGDGSGRLVVSFAFDASSPAALSIFVGAAEDAASRCALRSDAPPGGCLLVGAGMGQSFPPRGDGGAPTDAAVAAGALMDAAVARALAAGPPAAGGRHALVVRLEAATGSDASAAATLLASLTPGAPATDGVQSQTTFAALAPDSSSPSGLAPRVLKQKIWVAGVSYELQEIYGMESAARAAAGRGRGGGGGAATATAAAAARTPTLPSTTTTPTVLPGTSASPDDDEERLCVICLSADRDTTALPCRHMCMCAPCAAELRRRSPRCPICRDMVESLLHIKLQGGGGGGEGGGAC